MKSASKEVNFARISADCGNRASATEKSKADEIARAQSKLLKVPGAYRDGEKIKIRCGCDTVVVVGWWDGKDYVATTRTGDPACKLLAAVKQLVVKLRRES